MAKMIQEIMNKTKSPLATRILAPFIIIGICSGLGVGLYIGWIAWPIQVTNVDISDLKGTAQEDYILLTAKTYAYDQNLDRARQRMALLNDANIARRVANLAIIYASQDKTESAQLASLAIALGSNNDSIVLLAQTPAPTTAPTELPTATLVLPPLTPPLTDPNAHATTTSRAVGATVTRTPTRRLTTTPTHQPAPPSAPTTFLPADIQNLWPAGFSVTSANVAQGQQYWHLIKAIYCDYPETQYGCSEKSGQTLPGGKGTIGVWITLIGSRAPLILDGKQVTLEDKSNDPQCQCTYSLDFPGPTIEVSGHPSDKIIGAANSTAVRGGFPNTHVRYFFTFQLTTR